MTAWMRGGGAVLVGVIFMVALGLSNPEGSTVLIVSNAGQLAAAVVAAAACARGVEISCRRKARLGISCPRHRILGGRPDGLDVLRGRTRCGDPVPLGG